MAQWVSELGRHVRLLAKLLKFNWQQETAYFGNSLISMITPVAYVLSFLVMITVLFQNINSLAGYSRDEMFFLIFIGQLLFYSYSFWADSAEYMERYVNDGTLDYILTKPVSSLFYVTLHRIRPLRGLVNFVGPLTPTWLVIDWSNLELAMGALLPAAIILFCGVVLYHQFQFLTSLVSFWTGRARQTTLLVYAASSQSIPLEGLGTGLKWLLLGVMPVFTASVVASVMLGKADPVFWMAAMLGVLAVFSFLKRFLWRLALKQYSSASS